MSVLFATRDVATDRRRLAVLGRACAVVLTVGALGAVHLRHRPATLCPLRALTGLPCPFCGGTAAAVRLGRLDVVGAVRASPLAVAMIAALPFVGAVPAPAWWRHGRVVRVGLVVATLVLSEVWQFHRFGLLGA